MQILRSQVQDLKGTTIRMSTEGIFTLLSFIINQHLSIIHEHTLGYWYLVTLLFNFSLSEMIWQFYLREINFSKKINKYTSKYMCVHMLVLGFTKLNS